jgi:hypothetical protein
MKVSWPALCRAILFTSILAGATAQAGIIVPTGLNPGDQYYLTFVTQDWRDGTSANINDYNDFVQAQAAQNPTLTGTNEGVQWRAVPSTSSVSALTNLGLLEYAVYLLDGTTLVATGGSDYWDGTHSGPTNLSQFLTDRSAFRATTGSTEFGSAFPSRYLGNGGNVRNGNPPDLGGTWASVSEAQADTPEPFYAVSQLLTVGAVPEPSTIVLAGIGIVGLLFASRRKRRV